MEYIRNNDEIYKYEQKHRLQHKDGALQDHIENVLGFSYLGELKSITTESLMTEQGSNFKITKEIIDFIVNYKILSDALSTVGAYGVQVQVYGKIKEGILIDIFAVNIGDVVNRLISERRRAEDGSFYKVDLK